MPIPNLNGCQYTVSLEPGFICLVDLDQGATITNVAEAVIQNLLLARYDLVNNRVIYQDTMGHWDELVVRDGQFAGFAPLQVNSKEQAIEVATRAAHPISLNNASDYNTSDSFFR
jgi:hypothetical protein